MWFPFTSPRSAEKSVAPSRRRAACTRPVVEPLQGRVLFSFSAPLVSPGGGNSLAVGDFNGDGRDDVVVLAANNTAVVSLSNGDGTFRPGSTLTGASDTLVMASAWDFNGDGNMDVVVSSEKKSGSTTVIIGAGSKTSTKMATYNRYQNVWLGNGDGTFGRVSTTLLYKGGYGGGPVYNPVSASADFDRDGVLDAASVNTSAGTASVSLGNADGTYQSPLTYAAGQSPGSIAAGDFNGDGLIDLVVVNSPSGTQPTLSVLLNDGNW